MALPTSPPGSPAGSPAGSTDGARLVPDGARDLDEILRTAVAHGASDVHLRAGAAPLLRVSGALYPLDLPALTPADTTSLVAQAMPSAAERAAYAADRECDFAYEVPGLGRFRVNAYRSQGCDAMVLRHVRDQVPPLDQLGLPPAVSRLADASAGLVLVCGPTGSGKSTTLAAMVDAINTSRRCHILTIEDPIEYLHHGKLATISQRELHTDTFDFAHALRAAMRQDPDVILIGEIRDAVTLRTVLQAAETGHLVLASLHAKSVADAVNRVLDLVPADEQRQARHALADSLQGIVCQQLVASASGHGRTLVTEIVVSTPRVKDAVGDEDKTILLPEIVADGAYYGMHTFEQEAVRLVLSGAIGVHEAEQVVPRASDLHVALRRAGYRG